jgi:hypothetical protein
VTATIARELEGARQKLLDLTLRNRLLNYRPSQLRSIRVTGELPAEIYDALVLRPTTDLAVIRAVIPMALT